MKYSEDAKDTTVYNQPLFGVGGMIGSHRYFNIDLVTETIELTETKTPETPGFNLIIVLVGIGIMILVMERKRNEQYFFNILKTIHC